MLESAYSVVAFNETHSSAWRTLNEGWILECGFTLEPKDHAVLGDPVGQVVSRGGHIFIVESALGAAVGCCALMPMGDGGLELAKMAVRPDARGRGLSKLLMVACIEKAGATGASRLYLETNSALAPALRLYEAFGFEYLPKRDTPYVRADVFMQRLLA